MSFTQILHQILSKWPQNEVDDTLSSQSHALGDLQKTSTIHSGVSGIRHSSAPITLLNELANKNSGDRMCASNTFPRTTCGRVSGSPASFDMFEGMQLKHLVSDSICSSVGKKFIPLSSKNTHQTPSVALPSEDTHQKSSVALSRRSREKRTEAMSAFTSLCPITLKRLCTRQRPQSNKETSATELTLASMSKRLITLQPGSCKRRVVRYNRNDAGQFADIGTCSTKSSTTASNDGIAQTSTNNWLDTASCNSEVNCDSGVGMTVSSEGTCDPHHYFDPIQPVLSDSTDQMCLSRSGIESQQSEEHDRLKSAVVSNLNVTEKERITHKCTEYLDCPQSSSAEETGTFLERDDFSQCSVMAESNAEPELISVDKNDIHERPLSSNKDWYCTFDASLGRKLFINTRTGHTSFEAPCEFNVKDDDCSGASVTEASEANDCSQHLPHPFASHLSFSCTPWLPREDRRHRVAACHKEMMFYSLKAIQENQHNLIISGVTKSQLTVLYKEHQERQETEEKLCKWTDADTLQAYEQELLNNGGKTVAELLDSWQNPVFTAPEKDILMVNKPAGDKTQISVHNVVHPYCFTRDMLAGMRVLRQLDDKFIVGIVSQEGEDDGLLVLVDQHAAHERVRLERLQSELFDDGDLCQKKGKPCFKSSPVSPPLEFPLFPEEVRLLKTFQTEIERIGISFVIRESSLVSQETMILVHGVPSVFVEREVSEVKRGRPSVAASNVKALIREHLEHVSTTCGVSAVIPKVISQVISSLACHGAVKFGEPLGINECQELIKCLSKCQLPFQCAHGRPSVIPLVDLKFLGKK
ncbi:DNA mismatch repair protein [Desmophyllum pertusum]|uniref:DNA mismatch repair protein n=1 Tax=Desmophyllum pertusum TaxID=174260 RepID=A0A9W9YSP9_9CNID|nr:DNA mismatch repair protein [Desmophyllum pertusum]